MSLSSSERSVRDPASTMHTVDSALELLRSLQPQLSLLCASGKCGTLQANLERIGAFESKQGARVLWVSPREDEGWDESEEELEERMKLVRVSELVHQAFKDAGYIVENRPLKLHCTLINTSHRKPFSKKPKLFSFTDILASKAFSMLQPSADGSYCLPNSRDRLARVALGTYDIPEIQLCAMGSHGPEDEYVSLGGVTFSAGAE
ncbi:hypothetical protein GYMLUDRAFT_68446 [Collybiopsis luxurians FD-317 M1]|nr:hypothetical protein GYMLUDRAFT_68446 [Collybiopsis luxurians FD-317 M1]